MWWKWHVTLANKDFMARLFGDDIMLNFHKTFNEVFFSFCSFFPAFDIIINFGKWEVKFEFTDVWPLAALPVRGAHFRSRSLFHVQYAFQETSQGG